MSDHSRLEHLEEQCKAGNDDIRAMMDSQAALERKLAAFVSGCNHE